MIISCGRERKSSAMTRPKVSSAEPGGTVVVGRSKWVMPRSKAARIWRGSSVGAFAAEPARGREMAGSEAGAARGSVAPYRAGRRRRAWREFSLPAGRGGWTRVSRRIRGDLLPPASVEPVVGIEPAVAERCRSRRRRRPSSRRPDGGGDGGGGGVEAGGRRSFGRRADDGHATGIQTWMARMLAAACQVRLMIASFEPKRMQT